MKTKICTKCEIEQPISNFYIDNHKKKIKLSSACKSCNANYRKHYRKENKVYCWCIDTLHSHRRKYKVDIVPKELFEIAKITTHCHYCGVELQYGYNKNGHPLRTSPSLDRIDNALFLTLDNIEIICYKCNSTKLDRTKDEFIDYCRMVGKLKKSDEE